MLLARRAVMAAVRSSRYFSAAAAAPTPEELERKYLLLNYNPDGVRVKEGLVFERGKGSTLYDSVGRAYTDFAAGIAVNSLGHSDEGLARVLAEQALKIQHTSNIYHTREPLRLAQLLAESTANLKKVFLCNSGTEANEAALKFAKKWHLNRAVKKAAGQDPNVPGRAPAHTAFGCKGSPPTSCMTQGGMCGCWPQVANNDVAVHLRPGVLAFKASFHGRSMGSLAVTHKPAIRYPFGPFPADVRFAKFNNFADVTRMWDPSIGAIIVEPVQGEGGINPADPAFLRDLRALATEKGALLIYDEVQCGLGRTGRVWAHEAYPDALPDIMTLAKPLAGGLPIGATLMTEAVAAAIAPGDHGTTYGGNALLAAAAAHVFERISSPAFLGNVRARGAQLKAGCDALAAKYPHAIGAVRGTGGLFVGVDLLKPFKELQKAAVDRGLLLISAGENTIRLCPPLVISEDEVAHGLKVMDEALAAAYGTKA